ncbi:hypothetical protein F5B20DRAFT_594149 [Whalleya microplaca]|nr:hypothetical protein F5B20DRAFT_594149 [Whalleya microplaca]
MTYADQWQKVLQEQWLDRFFTSDSRSCVQAQEQAAQHFKYWLLNRQHLPLLTITISLYLSDIRNDQVLVIFDHLNDRCNIVQDLTLVPGYQVDGSNKVIKSIILEKWETQLLDFATNADPMAYDKPIYLNTGSLIEDLYSKIKHVTNWTTLDFPLNKFLARSRGPSFRLEWSVCDDRIRQSVVQDPGSVLSHETPTIETLTWTSAVHDEAYILFQSKVTYCRKYDFKVVDVGYGGLRVLDDPVYSGAQNSSVATTHFQNYESLDKGMITLQGTKVILALEKLSSLKPWVFVPVLPGVSSTASTPEASPRALILLAMGQSSLGSEANTVLGSVEPARMQIPQTASGLEGIGFESDIEMDFASMFEQPDSLEVDDWNTSQLSQLNHTASTLQTGVEQSCPVGFEFGIPPDYESCDGVPESTARTMGENDPWLPTQLENHIDLSSFSRTNREHSESYNPPQQQLKNKCTRLNQRRMKCTSNTVSWEERRSAIETLYRGDHLTMKQVKEEMDKQGFIATEREYYPRIKEWGLTKNIRGDEMGIIYRKMLQRKVEDGKETKFTHHGQDVDLKKVHRFVKRVALSPSKLPSNATPAHILAFTPRSPHKSGVVIFPWSLSPHKHFLRIRNHTQDQHQ